MSKDNIIDTNIANKRTIKCKLKCQNQAAVKFKQLVHHKKKTYVGI